MFTSSEILRDAWAGYNRQVDGAREAAASLGVAYDPSFKPRLFASYLKSAWRAHKGREALEAQIAAEAAQSPEVKAIRNELRVMDYSDAPTNWERHRELTIALMRASATKGEAAPSA